MKTQILKQAAIALILTGSVTSCAKEYEELGCDCRDELYYYASNEKVFLLDYYSFNDNGLLVGFEPQVKDTEISRCLHETGSFQKVKKSNITRHDPKFGYEYDYLYVSTKKKHTCAQLKEIIRTLEKEPIVSFAHLSFCKPNNDPVHISYCFYVEVKDKNDLADLYAIVQETNTRIKEQYQWAPEWFTLVADKNSKGNAMKVANYFFETGKFASSSVELIGAISTR